MCGRRMSVDFGRSGNEGGYLDGFWAFGSRFRPKIHAHLVSVRISTLVCPKIHAHPADWSRAPYGYTLEDSTRFAPAGASKETAYAHHLNRPARRSRRQRCACLPENRHGTPPLSLQILSLVCPAFTPGAVVIAGISKNMQIF